MAIALHVTILATAGAGTFSASTQVITFATERSAEKALEQIKETVERDCGATLFVTGVILKDVII